jgi:hypothetical protein
LPALGLHVGYNVILAALIFIAAHSMQRMRGPVPVAG